MIIIEDILWAHLHMLGHMDSLFGIKAPCEQCRPGQLSPWIMARHNVGWAKGISSTCQTTCISCWDSWIHREVPQQGMLDVIRNQRAHTGQTTTDLCRCHWMQWRQMFRKKQTNNSKNLAIQTEFCLQHGFQFHLSVIMNALIHHCGWSVVCNENAHLV